MERVEIGEGDQDMDLLSVWIAFNALYGQWDGRKREPKPDSECWRGFVRRLIQLDDSGHIAAVLTESKRLVMSLLEDEYLSRFYWEEPSPKRARQSKKPKFEAQTWYIERSWLLILDRLLERVYLMRCQLVHGTATYNGRLNRTALRRCVTMMQQLLPAFLMVWIDHGADEDWGELCYPPLRLPPC